VAELAPAALGIFVGMAGFCALMAVAGVVAGDEIREVLEA
jgi:hypothetical protein